MRYSKEHKLETHARIVKKASVRLREKGAHGIGVADLMKDAGLTHGGFYAHFDSREALVIEAFAYAMDRSTERWRKLAEQTPPEKRLRRDREFIPDAGRIATIPATAAPIPSAGRGNRPREPENPQSLRGQAGADDRHDGRANSGRSAQDGAQAGHGNARDHDGHAGAGPRSPAAANFPTKFSPPDARPCWSARARRSGAQRSPAAKKAAARPRS